MKNVKVVQTMTTEELKAEYAGLQKVAQDIINPTSGWINPDGLTGDLQKYQAEVDQRIDLLVQEIADREKNAKQISITKMLTAIEDIQNCFKGTPALRVFVRQLPSHIALEMKDELDELIQAKDDALLLAKWANRI